MLPNIKSVIDLFRSKNSSVIYYVSGDVKNPSWGTAVSYHHVNMLNKLGYKAFMIHHHHPFKLDWVDASAPVKYFDQNVRFEASDLMVVPEVLYDADYILNLPCKKIVHVQNAFFLIGPKTVKDINLSRMGYEKALVPMPHLKQMIEEYHGIKADIIPYFLPEYFFGSLQNDRKKRILIYSKFNSIDFNILKQILHERMGQSAYRDWEVMELQNKTHEETAALMKESMFFLNLNTYEAFNTSVPEAMAAGCINLCYEAFGGKDFLKHKENAYVFPNNYVFPLLDQLFHLIDHLDQSQEEIRQLRIQAQAEAKKYRKENTEKTLKQFYGALFSNGTG